MSYLISYAQNFEDVILWRALRDVSLGNYIDIGAQSPDVDSVSRIFHEQGWHGLHVDAMRDYANALAVARPGDRVLCAAVAAEAGELQFFAIPSSGLSTSDRQIAERHMSEGFAVEEIKVEAVTLDQVFLRAGFEEVHWLKIDIEGYEAQAIEGWKESPLRPWIVVVESTLPLSQELSFAAWEPKLLEKGYRFVYFDGLNRFYVSLNHLELEGAFGPGPNVFDNFTLSGMASAPFARGVVAQRDQAIEREAALQAEMGPLAAAHSALQTAFAGATVELVDAREKLLDTRESLVEARAFAKDLGERLSHALTDVAALEHRVDAVSPLADEVGVLRARLEEVSAESWEHAQAAHRWWAAADASEKELRLVRASLSWRLTRPLRARGAGVLLKKVVKKVVRTPMLAVMRISLRIGPLRRILARISRLHPGINARLRRVAINNGLSPEPDVLAGTAAARTPGGRLGTRAAGVLEELESALGIKGD